MIYSTRIDDLRPDVAVNCRAFVTLMRAAGFVVQIVNTVRDAEKQRALYAQGVTKAKVPTFHAVGVGLAFDICQGVAGHGYDNEEFWIKAGEIGMKLGFEWGFSWKTFAEKPHFQWSAHGRYTGRMLLDGLYPADMPKAAYMPQCEEADDMATMTDEAFAGYMRRYLRADGTGDAPSDWARGATAAMQEAGIFRGDGQGNFGWQKPITRESVAVVLQQAAQCGVALHIHEREGGLADG